MNENERNEHFQGFARLLWSELQTAMHDLIREPEDIIAERAYDLVYVLLDKAPYHSGSFDTGWGTPDEIAETIEHLPSFSEWPTLPHP